MFDTHFIVQIVLKQIASVGEPTIDTMVCEPQMAAKTHMFVSSNCNSKTKQYVVNAQRRWRTCTLHTGGEHALYTQVENM